MGRNLKGYQVKGESISVSYSSLSVNSANSSPSTPPLPSILSQTLNVITSAGGLLQLAGAKANTVLEDFETATESYAKKEVAETNSTDLNDWENKDMVIL